MTKEDIKRIDGFGWAARMKLIDQNGELGEILFSWDVHRIAEWLSSEGIEITVNDFKAVEKVVNEAMIHAISKANDSTEKTIKEAITYWEAGEVLKQVERRK